MGKRFRNFGYLLKYYTFSKTKTFIGEFRPFFIKTAYAVYLETLLFSIY